MMAINNINLIYILPIVSIILIILFYFFFEKIKLIINIYDHSDLEKRKIHLGNIPPIGGIIFYLIFLSISSLIFFSIQKVNFSFLLRRT